MDQEAIILIGVIVLTLLLLFVLPFIVLVKFSRKRMREYEKAAELRRNHPSKYKQDRARLEADYTWRRLKVAYIVVSIFIIMGVLVGASLYNEQKVCEAYSTGNLGGSTHWDRYRTGTTCKTLSERSEGVSVAMLAGISTIALAIGWTVLPSLYRYITPGK